MNTSFLNQEIRMTPAEIQRAANSARQFVRGALDLQSLQAVLQDLETSGNYLMEAERLIDAKRAEIADADARLTAAKAAADTAETRAAEQFAAATAEQQRIAGELRDDIAALERRRDTATSAAKAAEEQLAGIRAALDKSIRAATAAVA
jgi:chromosome segregation ATPase